MESDAWLKAGHAGTTQGLPQVVVDVTGKCRVVHFQDGGSTGILDLKHHVSSSNFQLISLEYLCMRDCAFS